MLLLGKTVLPDQTLPPADTRSWWERSSARIAASKAQIAAAYSEQYLRDNTNNREEALSEAYSQRIDAIKEATGVNVEHPIGSMPADPMTRADIATASRTAGARFTAKLHELAAKFPDKANIIAADVPIERTAEGVTRTALADLQKSRARATGEGLPGLNQFGNELVGSLGAMWRDPTQMAGLMIGGAGPSIGRTVGARILSRVFSEAAINGAIEAPLQLAAESWRKQSGVPLGAKGIWQQIGLAAAFGGGVGGLAQGGHEVLQHLARATPETEAALARVAKGATSPEDVQLLADAAGVKVSEPDAHALTRAIEDDAADEVAAPGVDRAQVAQVVAAIENGDPLPRSPEPPTAPGNFEFFDPAELKVDAARFQFKEGGDAAGVTDRLKGIEDWKSERAGMIVVFEDAQGQRFIADGHQRAGLAKRLQEKSGQKVELPGFVFREADGYTPENVRVIAALKNIGEGSGTALDAAKVLRTGHMDLKATGLPLSSALVRDAAGLARLSDDAFTMAVNEVVDPKIAAVVGRLADDQALHAQMLQVLKDADAKTIGEAQSMVRDLLAEPVFVERQDSLFGEAEVARMLLKEKAAVRGATLRSLRKDRQVFNRLIEEEKRIAEAGNVLDTTANTERARHDAILIEAIDRLSRQVGPIATALNEAAAAVAGGQSAAAASKRFVEAVRTGIEQAGGNLGRIGESGPPQLIAAAIRDTKLTEPATREASEAAATTLNAARTEAARGADPFQGTKIGDKRGNPITVYHGGPEGIETFKAERGHGRFGIYFTKDRNLAYGYAMSSRETGRPTSIYGAHLNVRNPLVIKAPGFWGKLRMRIEGTNIVEHKDFHKSGQLKAEDIANLKERGYDGIVNEVADEIVVFDPSQVRIVSQEEPTAAGVQVLLPGVEPVTIKMQIDNQAAKPMRGGDAAPPAGGLFDDAARAQLDILDAVPAGTSAEGKPLLTTHDELTAQADRVDLLAEVIASCKG